MSFRELFEKESKRILEQSGVGVPPVLLSQKEYCLYCKQYGNKFAEKELADGKIIVVKNFNP